MDSESASRGCPLKEASTGQNVQSSSHPDSINRKTLTDKANNFQSIEDIIYEIIAFLLLVRITIPNRKLFREWAGYNLSRNLKDLP